MKEFRMDITGYVNPVMVLQCISCKTQTTDMASARLHYLKLGRLHDFRWVKQ